MGIFSFVSAMVLHWFNTNSKYNKQLTEQNDSDDKLRKCLWVLHQDLKTSRMILYPTVADISAESYKNMSSDNKLVVRNFDGDIVAYTLDKNNGSLMKTVLAIPTSDAPNNTSEVIAKGIDLVVFTNRNELNNTVGIYMESGPSCIMDSVYMMNNE